MQNPFTHSFGTKPEKYISSLLEDSILENFSYDRPSERCYILTGVRGSGKTVLMSDIARKLSENESWIVCNLILNDSVVNQLASKLADYPLCARYFIDSANIGITIPVISAGIKYDKDKIFDITTLIEKMAETVSASGRKILITLDDIFVSEGMISFAQLFQHLISNVKDLPVYLIMTGLFQNYRELTDVKNKQLKGCTFLTRALEKTLPPLEESQMAVSYFNTFDIDEKESIKLAKMTKGYAFAYQVLGYWYFEKNVNKNKNVKSVEVEYRSELIRYSYNKLWSELSEKDKKIVTVLVEMGADEKTIKRAQVIDHINSHGDTITSSTFNKYRERLLGKGIISTSDNNDGMIWIPLPQFGEFIRLYQM